MHPTIHVFSGAFGSEESATKYSEAQWECPAPDDSWTAEAYTAWEERNPAWQLRDDLAVYLDSDFIETIFGDSKIGYLHTQLASNADKKRLEGEIPAGADTLILITSEALGGFHIKLRSTPQLTYHGEFSRNLGK